MSVARLVRFLVVASLLVIGVLLSLYGLLDFSFDEGGGAAYVTLSGHEFNAHHVGAVSLTLGVVAIVVGIAVAQRRRI